MTQPFLLYVLSRPHAISASRWERFYHDDHLDDLIKHKVATKGTMYASVPNPMGRDPPDTHTHLVLFETEHAKPFQSSGFRDVSNTSHLFPPGASTPDVSDLECRHYEILEVFEPKNSRYAGPAPMVLQTEIAVDDIAALQEFYRKEHVPMTAKHPGYRRATMYRYLETSVVYGITPDTPAKNSVIVIHEFDDFEGLGGPITKAALDTEYAARMKEKTQYLKARTLKLVCTSSSQR